MYIGVYGMTYEQFWYGDPMAARDYRRAYIERRRAENKRDWLQGAYFYNAVSTALANAFRKQGSKPHDYLEEPFPIFAPTEAEMAEKNRKEKEKIEAVYKSMIKQQKARKAKEQQQNAET